MNTPVTVPAAVIASSLKEFQLAGQRDSERLALWLGKRVGLSVIVESMLVPDQEAGYDFFEITSAGFEQLFAALKNGRLMIAAQVHTHPCEAYHSWADDKLAIVRHVGALSLVLPHFAMHTDQHTFIRDAAVFRLSADNDWTEVPPQDVNTVYQII